MAVCKCAVIKKNTSKLLISLLALLTVTSAFAQTTIKLPRGKTVTSVTGRISGSGERVIKLQAETEKPFVVTISSANSRVTLKNGNSRLARVNVTTNRDGTFYLKLSNQGENATRYTVTVLNQ